ncbi:UDP-N-acetylglucosamine 1-carboxyvinyltransferase [Ardenticatena maritima]|nr:UDP-N-acetylglucosamine 1-carboxyvinyltransferase [Ardenticatena maritima]
MEAYRIRGGNPIQGTFVPQGNKNAALPMIAATLLTDQEIVLENVPDIRDVQVMLALVEHLGATVVEEAPGVWRIRAETLTSTRPDPALCRQIRASFLLAGPLLAREGRATLPRPGGDRIGRRPLDTHIYAFEQLGVEVEILPDRYILTAPHGLYGADIFLPEASVTGTENVVMAATAAQGTTIVRNAAAEPHVQQLCRMINAMGGHIEGIGSSTLVIEGGLPLGGARERIESDYIEVGSFIGLAAVTGGELRIKDAYPNEHHRMTRIVYERLGIRWEVDGNDIIVPAGQTLEVQDALHGAIPEIKDQLWPGFPADLTSIALVLATQARGTVLIHEWMFEGRLFWVDKLISMGARIVLCDPHRAVVVGPSKLYGQELTSPDIRAGMALVIAALCAEGESTIYNIHQIQRGYSRLDERLRALGADIERITV